MASSSIFRCKSNNAIEFFNIQFIYLVYLNLFDSEEIELFENWYLIILYERETDGIFNR